MPSSTGQGRARFNCPAKPSKSEQINVAKDCIEGTATRGRARPPAMSCRPSRCCDFPETGHSLTCGLPLLLPSDCCRPCYSHSNSPNRPDSMFVDARGISAKKLGRADTPQHDIAAIVAAVELSSAEFDECTKAVRHAPFSPRNPTDWDLYASWKRRQCPHTRAGLERRTARSFA